MGMTPTTPTPDVFSQLAQQAGGPQQSAPTTAQAQAVAPQTSLPSQQGQGDVFDQLAAGSISPTQSVSNTPTPSAPTSDELRIQPNDSIPLSVAKGIGGTFEGIGEGVFSTGAGLSDILTRATGQQPGAANKYLHHLAGDDNTSHGIPQYIGQGAETLGEFIIGDEALKSLSLSDKFLQSSKIAKAIESSPRLARAVDLGMAALRSGAVQGADTFAKSGGDTRQAVTQGALGAGLTGAIGAAFPVASAATRALRNALDVDTLQKPLQTAITDAARQVAQEHGVPLPADASVRDTMQAVSDGLRAKARSAYQQLDSALGGTRFQAYDDQLSNVSKAIRESLGLDPKQDIALAKRYQQIVDAKNAALDEIRSKGLDPSGLIDEANQLHQRSMALQDVSKAVRQSTDVHTSLSADGKAAPAQVKTAPLFKRMQQLSTPNPKYPGTPSRLVQALGEQRAAALLNATDEAHLAAQKIAARNEWVKRGATAVGLAGLGHEAFSAVHSMLSGQ